MTRDCTREQKLGWLLSSKSIAGLKWHKTATRRVEVLGWCLSTLSEFATFTPIGSKAAETASGHRRPTSFQALRTGGSHQCEITYVYDFNRSVLAERDKEIVEDYNSELDRCRRHGQPKELDGFLKVDEATHKWIRNAKRTLLRGSGFSYDEASLRTALYRPFTKRFLLFRASFQ